MDKTRTYTFLLCIFSLFGLHAQNNEDIQTIFLDTMIVSGAKHTSFVTNKSGGTYTLDMKGISYLPQVFGNADPIHYVQMLPGIQTNAEYESGIRIQGCENSHNIISVEGVPIYNANHLLGFFSTFNAQHYKSLNLRKNNTVISTSNRLGGELEMTLPKEHPDTINGEISVGMISSQGTLRTPLGKNLSLNVSLRGSYINLLYDKWINEDDSHTRYSFYDANVTLDNTINSSNTILFDFYVGQDNGRFDQESYQANTKDVWSNMMGALHWMYDGEKLKLKNTLYRTSYNNDFRMDLPQTQYSIQSGIVDYGYKGLLTLDRWMVGAEAIYHHIKPQAFSQIDSHNDKLAASVHKSLEGTIFGNYQHPLTSSLTAEVGTRLSMFSVSSTQYFAVDPSAKLQWDVNDITFHIDYSLKHQYLFQTGFSSMGLPTEFWISADTDHRPQYSHGMTASVSLPLLQNRFRISADVFYKRLYNQVEYVGNILDLANSVSDYSRFLTTGNGENYGFSIVLNKNTGKLTGWINYTYTHARRKFVEMNPLHSYSASHERPHEIDAVLSYSPFRHWNFGASFVYASGTPYTPYETVFLFNHNLLYTHGEYNSGRLSPYCRLDLSADFKWRSRLVKENGINLSLYNTTCRKNELYYRLKTNANGNFAFMPVSFVVKILPSLSYYCKF